MFEHADDSPIQTSAAEVSLFQVAEPPTNSYNYKLPVKSHVSMRGGGGLILGQNWVTSFMNAPSDT